MDQVEHVLRAMMIEPAQYLRIRASAPWGISFRSRHVTRLVMIAAGACWLTSGALPERRRLAPGDCFIVRPGAEFTLEDQCGRDIVDCEEVFTDWDSTTAIFGGGGEPTDIVSGRFSFDDAAAEPLFAAMPPLLPLDLSGESGRLLRATFDLLAREQEQDGIGASLVTSRLADVLFVQAIRAICTTCREPGWLAAMRDPQLAAALRALHGDIAQPWTVASLAREAGLSRSAFAAAFRSKAGDTPLGYLTSWRIYQAKRLLRETPLSLYQIAQHVGYESGAALSRAFSRKEGVSPGVWRRRARQS